MKPTLAITKSVETMLSEEQIIPEEPDQSNFTTDDNQEPHINNENMESWENITRQMKENVYFR
jgi:hypothetical protein